MDIAALSIAMSQSKLMTEIGTAVLSKTLDTVEVQADGMVEMLEQSVNPSVGGNIDISL